MRIRSEKTKIGRNYDLTTRMTPFVGYLSDSYRDDTCDLVIDTCGAIAAWLRVRKNSRQTEYRWGKGHLSSLQNRQGFAHRRRRGKQ
jgi:hypothetical protein